MHDSDEWREIGRQLKNLSDGQIEIEGRLEAFESRQLEQHRANSKEIEDMKLALNGIPGDEENIGVIRKVDRTVTYAKSSAFWLRALAGALTLVGLYIGILVTWLATHAH